MRISDWSSDVCSSDLVAHESPTFETGVQARVGLRDLPVGASDRKGVPTTGVVRDDDSHRLRSNKRDEEVDSAIRARISERDCGSFAERVVGCGQGDVGDGPPLRVAELGARDDAVAGVVPSQCAPPVATSRPAADLETGSASGKESVCQDVLHSWVAESFN